MVVGFEVLFIFIISFIFLILKSILYYQKYSDDIYYHQILLKEAAVQLKKILIRLKTFRL